MVVPYLFLTALVAGLAGGYLAGGRLSNMPSVPPRAAGVVLCLVIAQVVILRVVSLPDAAHGAFVTLTCIAAGAFVLIAWQRWRGRRVVAVALAVIALGWALNTAVIAANGNMPVSSWALHVAGYDESLNVAAVGVRKHEDLSQDTRMVMLGDVIPIPHAKRVLSIGDVFLLAGIALFVAGAMRREDGVELSSGPRPVPG